MTPGQTKFAVSQFIADYLPRNVTDNGIK